VGQLDSTGASPTTSSLSRLAFVTAASRAFSCSSRCGGLVLFTTLLNVRQNTN
jgi:hypothetical protein